MDVSPSYQASADAEHPKAIITKKERRLQLVKLFIITFVSIATVALIVFDVIQTAKWYSKKKELTYKIQGSIDTALVIHGLQKERGMTTLRFGVKHFSVEEENHLHEIRRETNESIFKLEKRDDTELSMLSENHKSFWPVLQEFRRKVDTAEISVIDSVHTFRRWINQLISTLTKYTEYENLEDYAGLIFAYEMVILSKEEAGMERALGCLKFTQGNNYSILNTTWYNEKRILAHNYLQTAFLFSHEAEKTYSVLMMKNNNTKILKEIKKRRLILSDPSFDEPSKEKGYKWFKLMTKYNNILLKLQIQQADLIEAKVEDEIQESTNQLVIRSLLLCFTLIIVPCIIVSLARVQKRFYQYTLSLFDKVGLEQARTDFLMHENARYVDSAYSIYYIFFFQHFGI